MSGAIEDQLRIPTVTIVGTGWEDVAHNGIAAAGFADLPLSVWPQELLQGIIKDPLPTVKEKIDELINNLTKWAPTTTGTQTLVPEPATLAYTGVDYQDALAKMNIDFLLRGWGDGLPLLPATKERVEWLLTGTDLAPDEVVSPVKASGALATAKVIAINAAMAGARPEYMPVIIAGLLAARGRPDGSANPSLGNFVINGPIAKEIGINSTWHYLGPNPYYPANGSIGRTLMTLSHTVGGQIPGITNMQPNGLPGDYNSIVFAEAEDISPWGPLGVERGFAKDTNTITFQSCQSTVNLTGPQNADYVDQYLERTVARDMAYPHSNWGRPGAGMLVIPPAAARALAELGYSKQNVKEALWEGARIPWSWWEDVISIYKGGKGSPGWDDNLASKLASVPWLEEYLDSPPDALVPIVEKPDCFIIVVAGANQLAHWSFLMGGLGGNINTVEIERPADWAELLEKAPKFWEGAPLV